MRLRLHAFEPASRANGPGRRAVVWTQGCTLGCPGCFNPLTHDRHGGESIDVDVLAQRILAEGSRIEGLTLSGGEPLQQLPAVLELLEALADAGLTTVLFSGYRIEEIRALPRGPAMLDRVDVLVAGRYVAGHQHKRALLGSTNQRTHFLTDRYGPADLEHVPPREVVVRADGSLTVTGIDPWRPFGR